MGGHIIALVCNCNLKSYTCVCQTEKKRRQTEANARARAAAEEAAQRMQELHSLQQAAAAQGMDPEQEQMAAARHAMEAAAAASAAAAARAAVAGADDPREEETARQRRAELVQRVEEENTIRMEPIGLDRRHNRYWRIILDQREAMDQGAGQQQHQDKEQPAVVEDPCMGRLFVESANGDR